MSSLSLAKYDDPGGGLIFPNQFPCQLESVEDIEDLVEVSVQVLQVVLVATQVCLFLFFGASV